MSSTNLLTSKDVVLARIQFCSRAFSVAGTRAWNELANLHSKTRMFCLRELTIFYIISQSVAGQIYIGDATVDKFVF